jgi:hypothetical protein
MAGTLNCDFTWSDRFQSGSYPTELTVTNPVNYFDIGSPDPEPAAAVYSGLFG